MTNPGSDLFIRAGEAAEAVRSVVAEPPALALVLGSGLGGLVESLSDRVAIPYGYIPHFPVPTVAGHAGNLVGGSLRGTRVLALQGRPHYYEGHDLDAVMFPIRVLQRLGVGTLILTAATGAIRTDLAPGHIACLSDHLNLI